YGGWSVRSGGGRLFQHGNRGIAEGPVVGRLLSAPQLAVHPAQGFRSGVGQPGLQSAPENWNTSSARVVNMLSSGPRSEHRDIVRWRPREPVHRAALTAKTDRRETRHSLNSASIFENLTGMPSALLIAPSRWVAILRHPDIRTCLHLCAG